MEALCHGCLYILPRWPRRKSSQPQVQETNPLLERWVTHQPPTHQKCMPAPAAATRAWSSNGSSRADGLQGSPLPAYQHPHILPASFLVRSTLWLRIFSFNSIPNAFQRASHWTTDNPEMNASANRRFLSRSQKRVCESATFELAFSHSRRQVDAPFLPHVSCVPRSAFLLPQALRELVSPSDWAAAAAAPASAMASCFFSLISHTRSAPEARRSISAQWGARRWQRQDQWFGEKVETGSRRFRTTDQLFSVISEVFLHTFLHAIGPSNRMTTQILPPCEPRQ